jgi:hypothetical protein
MPARRRKDINEDIKKVVWFHINAGMTYRKISAITRLSVGAISAIKKVQKMSFFFLFFWGGRFQVMLFVGVIAEAMFVERQHK